jgi:hypothetical protein
MDMQHRFRGEAAPTIRPACSEGVGIVGLDVLRPQLAQGDTPQGREQVTTHQVAILVERLGRSVGSGVVLEPFLKELAQRYLPRRLVDAGVPLMEKLYEECFGIPFRPL